MMILAFVWMLAATPGQAQPFVVQHPADTGFLIELAQKMVARGEYEQAQDLLDKILEHEPDNPAIKVLLDKARGQKISKPDPVRPLIRTKDISDDIINIQRSILRYERHNRDLEFLIRQLVQENDLLYQTLSLRNRELAELRKKVYGSSGEISKFEVPSSVNRDRVKEIIIGYQDQIVERDRALIQRNQEVSNIVGEINKVNDSLRNDEAASDAMDASNAADLEGQLIEKRDHLINKALVVLDKSRDLSAMQEGLGGVTNSLKEANARYTDTINEYDRKIQNLKEGWAQDKSRQQEEIYSLRYSLKHKEKELERIQNSIANHGPRLESLKEGLKQEDQKIADTDAMILAKDKEIADLKRGLIVKDEEIGRGQKTIGERNATIAFAQTKTADLRQRVVDIHQSLSESDRALDELRGLVEEFKNRADERLTSKEAASLKGQIEDLKRQLDGSLQTLQEKDRTVSRLKSELAAAQKIVGMKDQAIHELEGRLSAAEADRNAAREDLKEGSDKLAILVDNIGAYKKNTDISSNRATDSEQKAYDLGNQLEDQMTAFSQEIRFLKEALTHKDQNIVDLKKELLTKEGQLKVFSREIEKATGLLNGQLLSRNQEPTTPAMGQASEPVAVLIDDSDWDPSDNDVYSLQKRLSILNKELKFAQEQLAVRAKEAKQWQDQLHSKEQQLRRSQSLTQVISSAQKAIAQTASAPVISPQEITKLQKNLDLARQDLALAKQSLDFYKTSMEKKQRDIDEKEKVYKIAIEKFERNNKEITDYKYRLQEQKEQIAAQQEALDHETKKNETLKQKLDQTTRVSSGQQQQFGGKERSIKEITSRLNNSEIRERDYKHQVDDIQGQLRTSYVMIKDAEARIEELKRSLSGKEARIGQLESRLRRAKGNIPAIENSAKESAVPAAPEAK